MARFLVFFVVIFSLIFRKLVVGGQKTFSIFSFFVKKILIPGCTSCAHISSWSRHRARATQCLCDSVQTRLSPGAPHCQATPPILPRRGERNLVGREFATCSGPVPAVSHPCHSCTVGSLRHWP